MSRCTNGDALCGDCLHAIGAVVLAIYRSLHLVFILLQYDVFTLRMHDTMTAACYREILPRMFWKDLRYLVASCSHARSTASVR